jgi:hypothetical protein
MYKVASDRRQDALRRGKLSDWVNGEEVLSIADQVALLKNGMLILERRIATSAGEERKAFGLQKLEMQKKLTDLNRLAGYERRLREGIAQYIVDAARELLTKSQFELIYKRAQRDWDFAQKQIEQNNPHPAPRQ